MKIYRLLFLLLLGIPGFCQTHTFPALDTPNVFTGSNTFNGLTLAKNFEQFRYADDFATIQLAINDCPAAPTQCWVIIPTGEGDTTSAENLTIPVNVGLQDYRAKPSLNDGNTSHIFFGGNTLNHGFELEAAGGSNPGGEGASFVAWNNDATACGAATCTVDKTSSVVWSQGPLSARLYSFLIHGGWWDGSAWHPDPDFMTNSGKTASAAPGKSRLRIGATGAFVFNPATTAVTSQLDPEISETNGLVYVFNDQVGNSGQAFAALGRNHNWSVMPQKWGGTFANTATDPPSTLTTLNGAGNGVWIDSNCGSAGNNVCLQFRDSNGASGITWKMYNISAAGATDWNNSSGTMQIRADASTGNGTFTAGTYQVAGVPTIYRVTSDFTTANNTSLQAITGLVLTLPASLALNVPISCHILYSQATAAVADNFGIQSSTFAPTNITAKMQAYTSTTAFVAGNLPTLTTTTATNIGGSFTPSAITTVWNADIDAVIENASNGGTNTINIMVGTSNGADAITIKKDSFCRAF